MDRIEKETIEFLGSGPKTVWWISTAMRVPEPDVQSALIRAIHDGFVVERGEEFLYPQTDRRDGIRRKRGKRLKTWTVTRKYYGLTDVGKVLLPLDSITLGVV